MASGTPRRRRAETGAAAVEFALVAPLLLLLVFGIISYGYMFSFRQALSQAAAEGARAAAVSAYPTQTAKEQAAVGAINDALAGGGYGVTCSGAAAGSPLKRNSATVGSCSVVTAACAQEPTFNCVTVNLDYSYRANPLLPSVPGVGLVLPQHLATDSTARVS